MSVLKIARHEKFAQRPFLSNRKPKTLTEGPSDFTPAIADKLCERLAEGESLCSICAAEDMPSKGSSVHQTA